jgi:hypothetical protein
MECPQSLPVGRVGLVIGYSFFLLILFHARKPHQSRWSHIFSATLGACPLGAMMVFVDHRNNNIFFQLTAVSFSFLPWILGVECWFLDIPFSPF